MIGNVAAAAGLRRSTFPCHLDSRALGGFKAQPGQVAEMPAQAPGQLARDAPSGVEVTRILDEIPAHLVADQLVAEARRLGGVSVALYVADIDGSHLLRLAGSEEFPDHLNAPPAIGPEIVSEGLPSFYARLQHQLPGCCAVPLRLRGRVLGLLLCLDSPIASLENLAQQGAAALALANDYTDFIEAARRRKPTTPAAETQQSLLPPQIARIAGAQLAGVLLPSYEVGGAWFDFVDNRNGAWLAIADASGSGPTAAGLGAAALGALRAARRGGYDLEPALVMMHETIRGLGNDKLRVPLWIARWSAANATLSWVSCGHPAAYLADTDNVLHELKGPEHPPLGAAQADPAFQITHRQLRAGERLILLTDGVTDRQVQSGGTFGVRGVMHALQQSASQTAASTAMAIQQAVIDSRRDPPEDDATIVVMAVQ